jgi:hypothetical protein
VSSFILVPVGWSDSEKHLRMREWLAEGAEQPLQQLSFFSARRPLEDTDIDDALFMFSLSD